MEVNPLSIILVKSDSKGDRLLFRYPFHPSEHSEPLSTRRKNPYALDVSEDLLQSPPPPTSNIHKGQLTGFSDEVLSTLFAVKPDLCNAKFELKVNDVRFVSHPTLLPPQARTQGDPCTLLINIVFALHASASHSIVKCYYDLSKRLGVALRHEEQICGYISKQTQLMVGTHEEGFSNLPEEAFQNILSKCSLARNVKDVYDQLCSSGIVNIKINRWIPISFCLPQKVHQCHLRGKIVEPEDIDKCLKALRPYHGLLLLYPPNQLTDITPLDGSPSLLRLLKMYSPLKSFQTLAADADLTLSHVLELTAHLLYWAKATVIYPLCASNKYVISPDAPIYLNSPLIDQFGEQFPGMNLIRVIAEFSLPTSLGQKCNNPLNHPSQQSQLVQMMVWMLQHHLLLQLHTYIQFMPDENPTSLDLPSLTSKSQPSTPVKSSLVSILLSEHVEPKISNGTSEPHSHASDDNYLSTDNDASFVSVEDEKGEFQEELLLDFPESIRKTIFDIPASSNPEDLSLLAHLCRKGYLKGCHHIEEIMYLENLRRSQLLQLIDKFRDVLITYETEDPAIAMFSCSSNQL